MKKLVIDQTRLDPEVRLFRLARYTYPVILEKTLADEISAASFVGPTFRPLRHAEDQ